LVELRAGERVGVSGQRGEAGVVNGLEDAGAGARKLRLRERRGGGGEEHSDSRQDRQQSSRERKRNPRHWFYSCC
jgi:hypothetical protein